MNKSQWGVKRYEFDSGVRSSELPIHFRGFLIAPPFPRGQFLPQSPDAEEGGVGDVGVGEGGAVGDGDGGEAAELVVAITDGVIGAEGDAGGAAVGVVGADEGGAVGVAFFEEVQGVVDVGAGAEDVGDGELTSEAVVGAREHAVGK